MASPITTSGFGVQVMPRYPDIDPRLLAPQLSQILPAAAQGFDFGAGIARTRAEEQMRPLRQRLSELQLEDATARQVLTPLEIQRRRIELELPIEQVIGGGIEAVPRFAPETITLEDGTTRTERPAGDDIFATETVRVIDPVTGAISTTTRRGKPLQTVEQAAQLAEMNDYRDQLAAANLQRAEAASLAAAAKAESDKVKAEAAMLRAQVLQNRPDVGFVDVKREDGRTVRQYFPKGNPQKIIHEIDRGELGNDLFNFGTVIQGGGAPAKTAAAASDFEAGVRELAGIGAPAAESPRTFNTVAEAEAAGAAGLLKPGTKIIVGGRPATWQ